MLDLLHRATTTETNISLSCDLGMTDKAAKVVLLDVNAYKFVLAVFLLFRITGLALVIVI